MTNPVVKAIADYSNAFLMLRKNEQAMANATAAFVKTLRENNHSDRDIHMIINSVTNILLLLI